MSLHRPLAALLVTLVLAIAPARGAEGGALLSDAELDRLQAQLSDRSAARRLAAARSIEQADREGFLVYAARLGRPLASQPATIKRLIHAVWGQYPNPDYPRGPGKDPPMWL